jgi:thiol-disulfide isomerase/thioredoxin
MRNGFVAALLLAAACARPAPEPITSAGLLREVASRRGSVVWVNIWGTWCGPCVEEFPLMLDLEKRFGPKGLDLLLVSADFASERASVRRFLGERGIAFPTYVKEERDDPFIAALGRGWSGALPAHFIFDRNGRFREFWEGEIEPATLRRKIESYFLQEVP